jgi:hypothetical protein
MGRVTAGHPENVYRTCDVDVRIFLMITVFWDVTPCTPVDSYQSFQSPEQMNKLSVEETLQTKGKQVEQTNSSKVKAV